MPHLLKFVHKPGELVVLNELNAGYRQYSRIPSAPRGSDPSWQGYSSGKWSGDTLVIDTIGLRDDTWIDWNGSVLTQAAKVRSRSGARTSDTSKLRSLSTIPRPIRSRGPSH